MPSSSKKKDNFYLIVRLRPNGKTKMKEVRRYIAQALISYGDMDPDDGPFRGMNIHNDVAVQPFTKARYKKMPKIPVNLGNQPLEMEPLDEGIPYRGVVRKMDVSDKADKRGNFYLTGGQVEIISPEEWKGRSAFINYLSLPVEIEAGMDIAARRQAEEVGIEFARFCKAFKVPNDESGVDTDDMIGCEGEFMVRNEEYQGRKMAKVATFLI